MISHSAGSSKSTAYQPRGDTPQTYEEIRDACIEQGALWEDPDFPAEDSSIYFNNPPSVWPDIQWMRPTVSHQVLAPKYFHSGFPCDKILIIHHRKGKSSYQEWLHSPLMCIKVWKRSNTYSCGNCENRLFSLKVYQNWLTLIHWLFPITSRLTTHVFFSW